MKTPDRKKATKKYNERFIPIYACIRKALGIVIQKRRKKSKGRSLTTYRNKIKQLEKFYKRTFRSSQKRKKESKGRFFFCDKYPTLKSFMDKQKIKQTSK